MADTRWPRASSFEDLLDMVAGVNRHTDHVQEQIGRCVHCSCGARCQTSGRLLPGSRPDGLVFQVVLADGFVAFSGDDKTRAEEIAARHAGAKVVSK